MNFVEVTFGGNDLVRFVISNNREDVTKFLGEMGNEAPRCSIS